jgi:CheY-like chemotaxis protein
VANKDKQPLPKLLIVDDERRDLDRASHLFLLKHCDVSSATSVEEAEGLIRKQRKPFDIALVDLMLPYHSGRRGAEPGGIAIARLLREQSPNTYVVGTSAYVQELAPRERNAFDFFVPKGVFETSPKDADVAADIISRSRHRLPRIFIIHGHDSGELYKLKDFLQNTLRLGEPIVLRDLASSGRTIIEKFEHEAWRIDVAIAMLTSDDTIAANETSGGLRRARQNVIFETGFFYSKLQRTSGRVIILRKGAVELPSDLAGIVWIDISGGVESAAESIRREFAEWM